MSSKKTILEKVKYFYDENASTVISVWGSTLTRPAPISEGGTITAETQNPLGNKTLTTSLFAVSIPVSNETLKLSGVQFESELQGILADTFSDAIAWEIFNGTGTGGHFASVFSDNANIITSGKTALTITDLANLALSIADKTDNGCIFEPKKTAGTLTTTFDVDMYLAGIPTVEKNFSILKVK